jgi:hypothetical protein
LLHACSYVALKIIETYSKKYQLIDICKNLETTLTKIRGGVSGRVGQNVFMGICVMLAHKISFSTLRVHWERKKNRSKKQNVVEVLKISFKRKPNIISSMISYDDIINYII